MSTAPGAPASVEPKPWQTGLAPVYIGVFLWIAFSDRLGRRALPVGGLGWAMLGALAAGPLAYALLFRVPATWGWKTGRRLDAVAAGTFGVRGAPLVPGLLMAMGQVVLFAVAVGYAVDLTFDGLVAGRMVDPRALRPVQVGGATLRSPLVLATSLAWAIITGLVSFRFTRWIAALMQYFPLFPALLLGVAMVGTLTGLRNFRPTGVDPLDPGLVLAPREGAILAFLLTFQWVFGFAALAGVAGVDWGAGSVALRDVRAGGWVGFGLAPVVVAALALLAVAGHQGSLAAAQPFSFEPPKTYARRPPSGSTIGDLPGRPGGEAPASSASPVPGPDAPPFTLRAVLVGGFDRRVGFAMLLIFGLASLAPAIYASFGFGRRFSAMGPGVAPLAWTLLGATAGWLLIVGGWAGRPEDVFNVLGAAFAPVSGAMAADYALRRGRWPGPRRGVNPPGLIAWALGLAVGLVPTVARALGSARPDRFQPAALGAFAVAFLAYALLALARLESRPVEGGA